MIEITQVSNGLAGIAEFAGNASLLTIGVNESLSNALEVTANVASVMSTKISGRSVFANGNSEPTLRAPIKTIGTLLAVFPNAILGTDILFLKRIISIAKGAAALIDVVINRQKLLAFNGPSELLGSVARECAIALIKITLTYAIFSHLLGTRFKLLAGPAMFLLLAACAKMASDERCAFLRTFVEGLFELMGLPMLICGMISKILDRLSISATIPTAAAVWGMLICRMQKSCPAWQSKQATRV
jgi:hypothetical protein